MSSTANSQTVGREAQDSSVRSVNLISDLYPVSRRQRAKARKVARQIDGSRTTNPRTVAPILAALAAFGGHITRLELPAQ